MIHEIAEYYDVNGCRYGVCLADNDETMLIIGHDMRTLKFLTDDWNCNFLEEFSKVLISIDTITSSEAFVDIVLYCRDEMLDGEAYMSHEEYNQVIGKLNEEHQDYIMGYTLNDIEIDLTNAGR